MGWAWPQKSAGDESTFTCNELHTIDKPRSLTSPPNQAYVIQIVGKDTYEALTAERRHRVCSRLNDGGSRGKHRQFIPEPLSAHPET
jgi:hypothetical protein